MNESTASLSEILDDLALFRVPRTAKAMHKKVAQQNMPDLSDDEFWSKGESTGDSTNSIEI